MGLSWNNDFSVGSAVLDVQHQRILLLIDELESLLSDDKHKTSQTKILLNDLTNYAAEHFETEERTLDEFAYADQAAHKQEHIEYIEYVASHLADACQDETKLVELQRFLKQWWSQHILVEDKKYKPYIELSSS